MSVEDVQVRSGVEAASAHRAIALVRISRAVVSIYKERLGRGPRNAHSHFAGPDAITCVLEGAMTQFERTLAAVGEHDRVRELRSVLRPSVEQELREQVEAITGRRIVALTSALDPTADVATDVFLLQPEAQADGDGRRSQQAAPARDGERLEP